MQPAHGESDLSIGVTGHRLNRVSRPQLDRLAPEVVRLMAQLASLAARRRSGAAPRLWVHSALAEGADQHLAELALQGGWSLHALLPFDAHRCAVDFDGAARSRYEQLLACADRRTELAGRPDRSGQAYRQLGHAILDRSDLLLAVWDGGPARGPGGTAEVVGEALRRHIPVIHLSTRPAVPPALLWQRSGHPVDATARRHAWPCEPARLASAVRHARGLRA